MSAQPSLLLPLLLTASPQGAYPEALAAEAQCRYLVATAEAEGRLLEWPRLFASGGVVSGSRLTGDEGLALGLNPRLTAGLEYDFVGLYQAGVLRKRAEAECRRQLALGGIENTLETETEIALRPALEARAAVLDEAMPRAEAIVAELRRSVSAGESTAQELDAAELRRDGLRALGVQTARELASLPAATEASPSLVTLVAAHRAADSDVERFGATLREAGVWNLTLRGGYDQVFGIESSGVPLFGLLTLTFNLGGLALSSPHAQAAESRRAWVAQEDEGVGREVGRLQERLRASRDAERERLRQATVLLRDLESRLGETQGLQLVEARRYRDVLFFELTRLRAEAAYLQAHVEGIDRFLGQEAP